MREEWSQGPSLPVAQMNCFHLCSQGWLCPSPRAQSQVQAAPSSSLYKRHYFQSDLHIFLSRHWYTSLWMCLSSRCSSYFHQCFFPSVTILHYCQTTSFWNTQVCLIKSKEVCTIICQLKKVVSLLIARHSDYLNKANYCDLYHSNFFMWWSSTKLVFCKACKVLTGGDCLYSVK